MSTITAESILQLVDQLTPFEQEKFKQLLERRVPVYARKESQTKSQRNGAQVNHLKPLPMPDGKLEREWLTAHRQEYADQWVALDGSRLIAASKDHDEVWAAADADGAYLPLITFVENPDQITHIIWT